MKFLTLSEPIFRLRRVLLCGRACVCGVCWSAAIPELRRQGMCVRARINICMHVCMFLCSPSPSSSTLSLNLPPCNIFQSLSLPPSLPPPPLPSSFHHLPLPFSILLLSSSCSPSPSVTPTPAFTPSLSSLLSLFLSLCLPTRTHTHIPGWAWEIPFNRARGQELGVTASS